jgi:hypothetical protein
MYHETKDIMTTEPIFEISGENAGNENLIDNLTLLGLKPTMYASETTLITAAKGRFGYRKYVIAPLPESIFFLAGDSGMSRPFTGLYATVDLPADAEFKIYKRNWFDRLIYFKRQKIGVRFIDDNITVTASKWIPSNVISEESVNLFLQMNDKNNPYCIVLQNDYLPMIEVFRDKMIIGIETYTWLFKKEDLRILLETGFNLMQNLKNSAQR